MSTRSTFKVLFYLKKGRETASGEVMIMARITVNGEQCQFSTKQKIAPNLWSVEAAKAIGRSKEIQKINLLLDEIKANIIRIYHDMQLTDNYVTAEKVRNRFMGNNEDCATILELFLKHNEDVKSLIGITKSKSTYQKYEVARKHLSEFIRFKYNMSDMYVNEITPMFIDNLKVYLMTVAGCAENTTSKFLQSFKRIIIIARDNGFLKIDPFANHKIRIKKVDRGYLTEQEVATIVQKKFASERLSQVRDIFVFSCFSGLAYIDLANLTKANIKTSFDGNLWIMTKRQKTNTTVNVPLMKIPRIILAKYEGKLKDDMLLPMISNQKLNCYLKEIADICGIDKNLTFHLARHTFATTTTLAKGIPIETVSRMLGHTNISTTQIYARITNDKISKDMDGLSEKFSNIENMFEEEKPKRKYVRKVKVD
ncbi:MAG: site-specific integrase [Rikenellaceae bacterium]